MVRLESVDLKKEEACCGAGGTGFGVRLLWDWLEKNDEALGAW